MKFKQKPGTLIGISILGVGSLLIYLLGSHRDIEAFVFVGCVAYWLIFGIDWSHHDDHGRVRGLTLVALMTVATLGATTLAGCSPPLGPSPVPRTVGSVTVNDNPGYMNGQVLGTLRMWYATVHSAPQVASTTDTADPTLNGTGTMPTAGFQTVAPNPHGPAVLPSDPPVVDPDTLAEFQAEQAAGRPVPTSEPTTSAATDAAYALPDVVYWAMAMWTSQDDSCAVGLLVDGGTALFVATNPPAGLAATIVAWSLFGLGSYASLSDCWASWQFAIQLDSIPRWAAQCYTPFLAVYNYSMFDNLTGVQSFIVQFRKCIMDSWAAMDAVNTYGEAALFDGMFATVFADHSCPWQGMC